jgi:hypothetical protein
MKKQKDCSVELSKLTGIQLQREDYGLVGVTSTYLFYGDDCVFIYNCLTGSCNLNIYFTTANGLKIQLLIDTLVFCVILVLCLF